MTPFDKLLGYVHQVFDKDPHSFLALRIRHRSAGFRWVVEERTLYGFNGENWLFSIALERHTLRSLCSYLLTLDGIAVSNVAPGAQLGISAAALLSGSGAQAQSNGDALYAYTSLLWMYLDIMSVELTSAKASVVAMLDQMTVTTADGEWLDEWGGYFGVPRGEAELDVDYGPRIVAEVIRPRENNIAMASAIGKSFGSVFTVTDVVGFTPTFPRYDGAIKHGRFVVTDENTFPLYNGAVTYDNGQVYNSNVPVQPGGSTHLYNSDSKPLYGLFDVGYSVDLESGTDIIQVEANIRAFVERFRAAGTHMRMLVMNSGLLTDGAPVARDDGVRQVINLHFDFDDPAFQQVAVTYSGEILYDG